MTAGNGPESEPRSNFRTKTMDTNQLLSSHHRGFWNVINVNITQAVTLHIKSAPKNFEGECVINHLIIITFLEVSNHSAQSSNFRIFGKSMNTLKNLVCTIFYRQSCVCHKHFPHDSIWNKFLIEGNNKSNLFNLR